MNQVDHTDINIALAKIEVRISELERRLDKTKIDKFFELATRFALPLIIAIGAIAFNIHNRVSYIEATRFTNLEYTQGLNEINKVMERELANVKSEIAKSQTTDPWIRDSFVKFDTKLDALKDNLDKVKERVIKLEGTK